MTRPLLILLAAAAFLAGCNREREYSFQDQVFGGVPLTMKIIAGSEREAQEAHDAALAVFWQVNNLMSDYQPNSEISRLNRSGGQPVQISTQTEEVLRQSVHFSELTGGAFDVTAGPVIKLWKDLIKQAAAQSGEGKPPVLTAADLPTPEQIDAARKLVGYRNLVIEKNRAQATQPGMRVDLGGIAKGYAVDKAVEKLKEHGIKNALVDAGGDGYALGRQVSGRPWTVGVQNPRGQEDQYLPEVVALRNKGYATSGDYVQYFDVDGVRYAHIVDPRTGQPARVAVSVTVIADDCTTADAMATGVSVLGPDEGIKAIGKIPGAETLVIWIKDGKLQTPRSAGFKDYER